MEAYNNSIYPVFEADQVLSQKELNALVSHLEEQDRLTRKNLIGIGIVCGLDITFPNTKSVTIACGTAVTSLGFQMAWKGATFTQFRDYEIPDTFLKPDYTREPYLQSIFEYSASYEVIKNCVELLPNTATGPDVQVVPDAFFEDKIILLFLEVTLIDQKNCVTTNCDDKGKRMEFNVRPLVIPLNETTKEWLTKYPSTKTYDALAFPRYNVSEQFKKITTAAEVLEEFKKVIKNNYLKNVSDTIQNVYTDFQNIVTDTDGLSVLEQALPVLNQTVDIYQEGLSVQYLWDWIFDITEAYNEIVAFSKLNPSLCCVDEQLFPFHVVLGGLTSVEEAYRTPFIPTLNSSYETKAKRKEITFLFQKLALIINSFEIPKQTTIKVTPSTLGKTALSEKAIPFYYNSIEDLNKKWNPKLTAENKNDTILSYHADVANYTDKDSVKQPLLYDLEPYNFFRIEGHIGKNYEEALVQLTGLKDNFNLPFKIIALNAQSFLNKEVDIKKHQGDWGDLELDYDMSRTKVFNITQAVVNWITLNKQKIISESLMTENTIASLKNILAEVKTLLTEDLTEFLSNYKGFYEIFKNLNVLFLFHRFCLTLNRTSLSVIAEDLIDHLDEINELFLEDPFTVIYNEALKRWSQIYKELFLSTFLEKHKGMEHKAGVTKGGTFIMVYSDSSIFKKQVIPSNQLTLLTTITNYNAAINLGENSDNIKDEIKDSVVLTKTNFKEELPYNPDALKDCKEQTEVIKQNLIKLANYNLSTNYPKYMQDFFVGNLGSLLQFEPSESSNQNNIQEKVILADFYIPYLCCSQGNNINIVLGNQEPSIGDFDPTDFNTEDFQTN